MNACLTALIIACLLGGIASATATHTYLDKHDRASRKVESIKRITGDAPADATNRPDWFKVNLSQKRAAQGNAAKPGAATKALQALLPKSVSKFFSALSARIKPNTQLRYDNELAMLLDVTALGMRAGMAFDQAFELALRRMPGELARLCLAKLEIWQKGLITREQGLRELESQIQTVLFSRFAALVLRALRYGAPMTQLLLALSEETRRDIRIKREEEVAKAPVKMLIPTGALILPAMLLLVLGPIMLDLLHNM